MRIFAVGYTQKSDHLCPVAYSRLGPVKYNWECSFKNKLEQRLFTLPAIRLTI